MSELRRALEAVAVPDKAPVMAAYMKDQFVFLGVRAPDRRAAQKPLLQTMAKASAEELIGFAHRCWAEPEREFQYVAMDVVRKHQPILEPDHLDDLAELITTKSWWDTVDSLATHSVGPLVARHRELSRTMDQWINDDNLWLARTAILHQLFYKEQTDAERLFGYAQTRASDSEFFIRKALGWALRQYARVDPDAVQEFVAIHADELSGLTKREALKHLDR